MTTDTRITFHVCPLTEPGAPDWVAEMNAQGEPGWMLWAMQLEQEAEEAARILAADTSDRMAGRCDMCRVWPDGDHPRRAATGNKNDKPRARQTPGEAPKPSARSTRASSRT